MLLIANNTDKKLLIRLGAATLLAAAAALVISLLAVAYAGHAVRDSYAGIIGTVAAKYPAAEEEVVEDIENPGRQQTLLGYQILQRYGWKETGMADSGIAGSVAGFLYPACLFLTLLICAVFIIIAMGYQQAVAGQVAGLTDYLRRIYQGDYSLAIRDNAEGNFSLLKNEIYKITVMLKEQAEALGRDKLFLAGALSDISHQIKTPLTSLLVLTDLLSADPPPAAREEFLARLRSQLERVRWLAASLLKLSRLDSGTAELQRRRVNLQELVEKAVEPLRIPAEIKNLRLVLSGDQEAGFIGDLNWSVEAVTNIVKNCIEHTDEGGRIEVTFGGNNLYAFIKIEDNGEGIPRRDLPYIFKRFYRGGNAGENSVGIGLAMAKAIFQRQDGDISVTSEEGRGTCFQIKIFRGVV